MTNIVNFYPNTGLINKLIPTFINLASQVISSLDMQFLAETLTGPSHNVRILKILFGALLSNGLCG